MTAKRAEASLAAVFLVALTLQVITILWASFRHYIFADDLRSTLTLLFEVYSVHFAVLVGGAFSNGRQRRGGKVTASIWLALVSAALWNGLLAARFLAFAFASEDSITDVHAYIRVVASSGSFLVAGVLAHFFATRR